LAGHDIAFDVVLGLAALHQERISRLTLGAVWRELPPRKPK
jgi:hypothetical protein